MATRKADPLRTALRLQRAAARQGFDWPRGDRRLWDKFAEEIGELKAVQRDRRRAADELGDLLFMIVNLARHLDLDLHAALSGTNRKFARRYGHVMRQARMLPPLGDPKRLDRMEALWVEAKRLEQRRGRK